MRHTLELSLERPDRFDALELTIGQRRFGPSEIRQRKFAATAVGHRTIVRLTLKNVTKRTARAKGRWTLTPVGPNTRTDLERRLYEAAVRIASLPAFEDLPREIALHEDWTAGDVARGKVVVPENVRRSALQMASQYLAVAFAREADASAVAYLRRVMDFALRRRGPLFREKGGRGFLHEPPVRRIKAAQSALVVIFEGAGLLPMHSPFDVVRVVLRRLLTECRHVPKQFREVSNALRNAKQLAEISDATTRSRVQQAMNVIAKLYDPDRPERKRLRIALGRAGGRGEKKTIRPWTAAHEFAEVFIKGWMPKTRYESSRPKRKRNTTSRN